MLLPVTINASRSLEFVEKKYQVFDIVGALIILVQVNLSSRWSEFKSRRILESVATTTSVRCLPEVLYVRSEQK